ncbi:PREDICTED: uncharacterized protein LOC106297590 [Brassica oleracea var. oleracea]|uniref:uncharacterized protein LOC106297590 n=1 Tax=Brassica oleracea var. oleracea TaxID=109376 RepID=UPI0006A6AB33|nr:PREDICTED: uncharacterized protein LOC106297590 [Brassica oleracea var. oleracea]
MSHGWRGILAGRYLLITNLGKVIGNGDDTRVWKDPWLSTEHPSTPMGPATERDQDLFVSDLICRGSGDWNIPRIITSPPHLLPQILRLRPSITGAPDSFAWLATKSGTYSVKSGYYVATTLRNAEIRESSSSRRKSSKARAAQSYHLPTLWRTGNSRAPLHPLQLLVTDLVSEHLEAVLQSNIYAIIRVSLSCDITTQQSSPTRKPYFHGSAG